MEFKGSEGEWRLSEDSKCDIITDKNGLILTAYSGGGICVEKISQEMAEANAKIALASKDLLKALQYAKSFIVRCSDWHGEDPNTELIDNAIEKALN